MRFWRDEQAGGVDEPDAAVCIGSHQVVGELGVVDTAAYALGDRIDLEAVEPGIVSGLATMGQRGERTQQ